MTNIETITSSVDAVASTVETTPTTTQTVTVPESTFYDISTITQTTSILTAVTVTRAAAKRAFETPVPCNCDHQKRSPPPLPTPDSLTQYSPVILSSACSAEVVPATATSIVYETVATSTSSETTTTIPVPDQTSTYPTTTQVETLTTGVQTVSETTTTTLSVTSTTTISVAAGAPTGVITYLQILPAANNPNSYALSDSASHMTDNYYSQASREVFIVTSTGQLYSVTHNAYYYREAATGGKLFWSATATAGDTLFTQQYDSTLGYNQLFLTYPTTSQPYAFCLATVGGSDSNSATGFHVRFYPSSANFPAACVAVQLFLQPV
jgi:hypothetical protein